MNGTSKVMNNEFLLIQRKVFVPLIFFSLSISSRTYHLPLLLLLLLLLLLFFYNERA